MKNKRRLSTVLVSLVLIFIVVAGGTVAYIFTNTGTVKNTFTVPKSEIVIEEDFNKKLKENVKVKNNSDYDVYIRASIIVNWVDNNGNISAEAPVLGNDYSMTTDLNNGWSKGNDGYYYFNKSVTKDGLTSVLIKECKALVKKEGYHLQVSILAESVQSNPADAVKDAWGITPDANGNIVK